MPISFGKHVFLYRRNATKFEVWIDGKLIVSDSYTLPLNTSSDFYGTFSSGQVFNGNFYQLHICTEYLTDDKVKKLMRYCALKTGLKI